MTMKNSISLLVIILISTFAFGQQPERFPDESSEKKENQNVSAPEEVPEKSESSTSKTNTSARKKSNSDKDYLRLPESTKSPMPWLESRLCVMIFSRSCVTAISHTPCTIPTLTRGTLNVL